MGLPSDNRTIPPDRRALRPHSCAPLTSLPLSLDSSVVKISACVSTSAAAARQKGQRLRREALSDEIFTGHGNGDQIIAPLPYKRLSPSPSEPITIATALSNLFATATATFRRRTVNPDARLFQFL